jgi:transcriptional regulator with XRE-family HTH domain
MIEAKNNIKIVLEQQGRSQVWLAKAIDRSVNTINAYVQNRTQPSLVILYKIAHVLNVHPKELLTDDNGYND